MYMFILNIADFHGAPTKSAMFRTNIYIYNQPSEDFAEEDYKVFAVLVCAWCTKHG